MLARFILVFAALVAGPAMACSFHPGQTVEQAGPATELAALEPGISQGWLRCGNAPEKPLVVWTLSVDETQPYVGVRDAPLFLELPANPLVPLTGYGYRDNGRIALLMSTEDAAEAPPEAGLPDRRKPHRLYGTLCGAEAEDALNCSLGGHRLKVRVDAQDTDGDGILDFARHELSYYSPGRLQVVRFPSAHSADPRAMVAVWMEIITLAGL
ncbi:MAG: hypothetical protein AAF675_00720 [Pseudomonadota bacterium]